MWWLAGLAVLFASTLAVAQPARAPGPADFVLDADAPLPVWINGLEVALAVSTGTVDHVTLNDNIVQRLGLSAVPPDRKGDLVIGGAVALQGRHGRGLLSHGQRLQKQQLYWFPGLSTLPLAGTIGPFALPHERIRIRWLPEAQPPGAAPPAVSLPLVGDIDRAAYGLSQPGGRMMLIGVDVRVRRPLPLATAATGADLAELLGGRFVGEPWQEEIVLGVRRPVRRLELDRPLKIGPMLISALAVRQGGPRDATARLAPRQVVPFDAEEDPEIMQVRGRIIRRRNVARYIMLTRAQLDAHGCSSLLVDKAARQWSLACAQPAGRTEPVTGSTNVAVSSATTLVNQVLPQLPHVQLALDRPVPVMIDGLSRALSLGDGGEGGMMLNARMADVLAWQRAELLRADPTLRAQMADWFRQIRQRAAEGTAQTNAPPDPMAMLPPLPGSEVRKVAPRTILTTLDVRLALGERHVQMPASWLTVASSGDNSWPFDGTISLAALPPSRLRLRLAERPPGGTDTALSLPIADRSHGQSVMGVATASGFSSLFIGLDLGEAQPDPIVSMAVGHDLIRGNGGTYVGETRRQRMPDYRLRSLRRMRLATPLLVGPLRFDAVLVDQVPGLQGYVDVVGRQIGARQWPEQLPWPDLTGIAGLERELRLTRTQLQAAGCHELVVDKPGRLWTLTCVAR